MTGGRLIAVVGPSGAGKDSVMRGIARAAPIIRPVQRTITRPPGMGGETYASATPEAFRARVANGDFCLHWQVHGLLYGIPAGVLADVQGGAQRMANLSRTALTDAVAIFPSLLVLHVTASRETLDRRLRERGRETDDSITARLARPAPRLPDGLACRTVLNDGALSETVDAALDLLDVPRGPR